MDDVQAAFLEKRAFPKASTQRFEFPGFLAAAPALVGSLSAKG